MLQEKIGVVVAETIGCEYSNMVIEAAQQIFDSVPALKDGDDIANKILMDKYYSYDFKHQYARFVSAVLNKIAERFNME